MAPRIRSGATARRRLAAAAGAAVVAVALDTQAMGAQSTSVSITTAKANEVLLIAMMGYDGNAASGVTVTVDSQATTSVFSTHDPAAGNTSMYVFSYVAPAAGAHTVAFSSVTGFGGFSAYGTGVIALQNATATGITTASAAGGDPVSTSLATTAGGYLVGFTNLGVGSAGTVNVTNITKLASQHVGNGEDQAVLGTAGTGGSITVSASDSGGASNDILVLLNVPHA